VPFQEHRAYLQHAGLAALTALELIRLIDARPVLQRPAIAAGVGLAVLFASMIVERGRVWDDPVALWSDAVSRAPGSYRAQANAGLALAAGDGTGRPRLAAALAIASPRVVAQGRRATRRSRRGTIGLRAIAVRPATVPALYNFGLTAQESDDLAKPSGGIAARSRSIPPPRKE
jgi:hypothetical protein